MNKKSIGRTYLKPGEEIIAISPDDIAEDSFFDPEGCGMSFHERPTDGVDTNDEKAWDAADDKESESIENMNGSFLCPCGFLKHHIKKGDRIAIIRNRRPGDPPVEVKREET